VDAESPRKRFERVVAQPEGEIDLGEAALLVAQEEYPALSPEPYLAKLDRLGERVKERLSGRDGPVAWLEAMKRVLFHEEGYSGNDQDYYDARNSFLNEVLDRKRGIPITLSLLYLAVARRAGVPAAGVGLPGHFIVCCPTAQGDEPGPAPFFVDPYHAGRLLTEKDCRELVRRIYDGRVPFRPESLRPVGTLAILARLLLNLKNIYIEGQSPAKALGVVERLLLLHPDDWSEVRDRGLLWYRLKSYRAALADLETYLRRVPDSDDRGEILELAQIIGRRVKPPA
jgi:regulator of sirC expression with transglutaminase-like and TPR domain